MRFGNVSIFENSQAGSEAEIWILTGTTNAQHMAEDLAITEFSLTDSEVEQIEYPPGTFTRQYTNKAESGHLMHRHE